MQIRPVALHAQLLSLKTSQLRGPASGPTRMIKSVFTESEPCLNLFSAKALPATSPLKAQLS